ncbi:MAG: T9SS type A sorting domain-containing protein [Chitinophagales bacterium]
MNCLTPFRSVLLFLLLQCGSVQGQGVLGLTTTSQSSTIPAMHDQLSVFTKLKNYSATDTFKGAVDFLLANKDSIIYDINIVGKPAFAGTVIQLAPLEEKAALFTVQILPSHFKVGPDIIIVWPVAAVQVIDSARAPIVIQPALGVPVVSGEGARLWMQGDALNGWWEADESRLGRVQITDALGQVVMDVSAVGEVHISLAPLPKGVYVATLRQGAGPLRTLRFVRP